MEPVQILATVWLVIEYIVKFLAIGFVPENRKPSSSSAWLLLILLLPLVGIPLFLLLGSPYVDRRRMRIQARANSLLRIGTEDLPDHPPDVCLPADLASLVHLDRSLTSLPMVHGNNEGIQMDTRAAIARMTQLVNQAQEYVHVGIYIMSWDEVTDEFFSALVTAAQRGIKVRVLYDHIGSRKYPGFHQLGKRLTAAGIQWHLMLPFLPLQGKMRRVDLRNHRKNFIVDGKVAIMGSLNMIEPSYASKRNQRAGREWHDITIELTGPIVASLEAVFATDWYTESGEQLEIRKYLRDDPGLALDHSRGGANGHTCGMQLVPSGPGFRTAPNLRLFTSLIYLAQQRVSIVSPYFVPDESMLAAIVTAGFRGVEVELYVGAESDQFMVGHAQSSYYEALLDAGVKIYQYPAPAILHTKCFTIDDLCAVVGSSNMDMRSFGLNFEISLLGTGGNFTAEVDKVIADYRSRSTQLTAEEWANRSPVRRWVDSAMRLTSAVQ